MKMYFLLTFLLSIHTLAHDDGHGPSLVDESHHGGKVSAIIDAKEVELGRKAKLLYKGELVYSSKNSDIKLYVYDSEMKPLDLSQFEETAKAVQIEKKKETEFKLMLDPTKKFFIGTRPKHKRVPFNIDVKLGKKQQFFGAFDNLD